MPLPDSYRIIYPWERSIAEHNAVATTAIAAAAEMRTLTGDDDKSVGILIPYDIYDTTVSYASRLQEAGDYLGASVLRANIGLHADSLYDGQ